MITIVTQPPSAKYGYQVMPVYNNISYIVSSNNTAQCKFKYIADIYVNGSNIKRLKRLPNQAGQAEFKINKVLQDYIKNDPQVNFGGFIADPNRVLEYQVKFGEEYDVSASCDSNVTVFTNLTNSPVSYTWNAAMEYKEYYDYYNTITDKFILSNSKPGKFLTHQPDNIMIGIGEQAELSYLVMPGHQTEASDLILETFDRNGNLLDTRYFSNTLGTVSNHINMFQTIGVGPENLNNQIGFTVINQDVFKYRVYLTDTASGVLNQNPFLQYMSGSNFWTTDTLPGCGSSFGITVADKMQFVIPDVSCGDTMTVEYTGSTFVPGIVYAIIVDIDTINNPSGGVMALTPILGGNVGTPFSGVGIQAQLITCGSTDSGKLKMQGFMDADTAGFGSHGFTVQLISISSQGGNRTSEYKYYQIDRRVTKYEPIRFRWLNQLGGYDSYSFRLFNGKNTSIERTEYDRLLDYNYKLGDRGRTLISVKATERINANSNWLTEKESLWMEELYTSLNVFTQKVNPVYGIKSFVPNVSDPSLFDATLICPLSEDEQLLIDNKPMFIDPCSIQLGVTASVSVLNQNTITINYPGIPFVNECASAYLSKQSIPLIPIIITTNSYDPKVRGRVKNINQLVEFEYAFDKNIQRN